MLEEKPRHLLAIHYIEGRVERDDRISKDEYGSAAAKMEILGTCTKDA